MRKARGRGEGCIFKRGDGRWYAVVSLGVIDGRRVRKEVSGKTKIEVQQRLANLRDEAQGTADESLTVAAWMARWLDGLRSRVRPGTLSLYSQIVRSHITPHIGYVLLSKLTPSAVSHFYSKLDAAGVSSRVRQAIHARLFSALKSAVRLGVVSRNVADAVDAPRYAAPPVQPLTLVAQARALLDAARQERLHALCLLAVTTGVRRGELFALRGDDVDLDAGTLSVRGTMDDDGTISPTKTARGRRRVDLSPDVIAVLRSHQETQPGEFIFTSRDGGPLRKSNLIQREWHPLLKRAGLERVKFHALRHTSATLQLSQGIHPKVVQERLGHSSIDMTLDTYSHVVPGMQHEAAATLDALLSDANGGLSAGVKKNGGP